MNDMGRGKTPEEWDSWTDEMKKRHDNGNGHGASLEIEILRLLPTPTARDWKDTGDLTKSVPDDDSLLPRAIAHHVTSAPTRGLSNDGNTSLDEQPPPQLTTED
ncbi:hypothetical protein CMI37_30495 [Candidatus Pacearchaeota archaeon]|nr:hypothetical protein [Candidatus Pacearchaeota archaeon]